MQKYFNSVADNHGNPVHGAVVVVTTYPVGAAATIYSDNGVTPIVGPLETDGNGFFAFYAADGRYTLTITNFGVTVRIIDVLLEDPVDGSAALAAIDGASRIGYANSFYGAKPRDLAQILNDSVSILNYPGIDKTGVTDSTVGMQAAFDDIVSKGGHPHIPFGSYLIDTLILRNAVYNVSVSMENPIFFGTATVARKALFQLLNCVGCNLLGAHRLHSQDKVLYERGFSENVQTGTSQATTRVNIYNATYYNFLIGGGCGEYDVDYQCSETTWFGAHFFRCPIALYNGGLNTGVGIVGGHVVSEANPHAAFASAPQYALVQEGGFVKITAGSIFTNPTGNYAVSFRPCKSASGNIYGTFNIGGAAQCEVNSPLLKIENPRGLSSPVSSGSSLGFNDTTGFCGASSAAAFIRCEDATYAGLLNITSNNWYALSARSGPNISSASTLMRVLTDKASWGFGFKDYIGGVEGGIVLHPMTPIIVAAGINTTIAAGAQTVVFLNPLNSGQFARYSGDYVSGLYTVSKGVKMIRITAGAFGSAGTPPVGDIYIEKNGSLVKFGRYSANCAEVSAVLCGLTNGDVIRVRLAGSASNTFDNGAYQSLVIEAET